MDDIVVEWLPWFHAEQRVNERIPRSRAPWWQRCYGTVTWKGLPAMWSSPHLTMRM